MFPSQASPKRNKKRKDERKQMRYVSKYSIPCLQSGSKPHLESVRIQVSLGREYDQFGVFLENQAMICFLSCSQSASQQNQAVYCWDSLSIQKTLYPAPTVFLQYQPIKPPSPLIPPHHPQRLCRWISFLGDEFIQIGALSKRALSRITCLLGGSVK